MKLFIMNQFFSIRKPDARGKNGGKIHLPLASPHTFVSRARSRWQHPPLGRFLIGQLQKLFLTPRCSQILVTTCARTLCSLTSGLQEHEVGAAPCPGEDGGCRLAPRSPGARRSLPLPPVPGCFQSAVTGRKQGQE